jgi:hypothetical protein
MKLNSDQAFELAQQFHDLSTSVGDYRFEHFDDLTPKQREQLKDNQFTLLTQSSHFITEAIGLVLEDTKGDLQALTDVTADGQKALKTIANVKRGIAITATLVKVGAAVASQNPAAITAAVQEAATELA